MTNNTLTTLGVLGAAGAAIWHFAGRPSASEATEEVSSMAAGVPSGVVNQAMSEDTGGSDDSGGSTSSARAAAQRSLEQTKSLIPQPTDDDSTITDTFTDDDGEVGGVEFESESDSDHVDRRVTRTIEHDGNVIADPMSTTAIAEDASEATAAVGQSPDDVVMW